MWKLVFKRWSYRCCEKNLNLELIVVLLSDTAIYELLPSSSGKKEDLENMVIELIFKTCFSKSLRLLLVAKCILKKMFGTQQVEITVTV